MGAGALLVASAAVLSPDEAAAHNCVQVRTYAPTLTTVGDTDCPHHLGTHICTPVWTRQWHEYLGDYLWVETWVCIED